MMKRIKAGFAVKDISPVNPVQGRLGLNHMIKPHHPICAKAVALKNSMGTYIFIVCEIVGLTKSENAAIRDIISKTTEIPVENIVITGTHTHSSPWIWDLQDTEARKAGFEVLDREWMDKVIEQTAAAGIQAVNSISFYNVKFGMAKTNGIASNRVAPVTRWSICADEEIRNAPVGLVDPNVRVLSFHDENDTPVFIFNNLACRPSAYGGGKTTKVSPDFPYIAEKYIKDKCNKEAVAAYWQGCAGNINSGKFVKEGSEKEVLAIGKRLFNAVSKALDSATEISGEFEYKYKKFSLTVGDFVKTPSDARELFVKKSNEIIEKGNITDKDVFEWRRKLKQLDVSMLSDGKAMDMEFQLIRFTDTDILFVPGEWYVQMYMNLAALFPKRNLIVTTLNNFDLLYVPDESSMPNKNWYGVKTDMRSLGDESAKELYEKAVEFIS